MSGLMENEEMDAGTAAGFSPLSFSVLYELNETVFTGYFDSQEDTDYYAFACGGYWLESEEPFIYMGLAIVDP